MFIRSERLFLRPGWPEDWEDLLKLIANEAIIHNLSTVPWPYTADDAREFIGLAEDKLLPRFLITVPESKGARLIGGCGLSRLDGEVYLGYWIAQPYWGRGYATEAVRAVLKLAVALGHRQIKAFHNVDNPASGRVLEKVGFHATGHLRERFSKGRNAMVLTKEYEALLASPNDCGDDDEHVRRSHAA